MNILYTIQVIRGLLLSNILVVPSSTTSSSSSWTARSRCCVLQSPAARLTSVFPRTPYSSPILPSTILPSATHHTACCTRLHLCCQSYYSLVKRCSFGSWKRSSSTAQSICTGFEQRHFVSRTSCGAKFCSSSHTFVHGAFFSPSHVSSAARNNV